MQMRLTWTLKILIELQTLSYCDLVLEEKLIINSIKTYVVYRIHTEKELFSRNMFLLLILIKIQNLQQLYYNLNNLCLLLKRS